METAYLHVNSRIKSLKYWKGFNNEQRVDAPYKYRDILVSDLLIWDSKISRQN